MVLRKVYEQAFWVYTVIVALAVREVLIHILPRFFNYYWQAGLNEPIPARADFYVELVRSIVFLIMIARFYLGGVQVFVPLTAETTVPPIGSWVHVLTGFIHFLLFFAWAFTAFVQAHPWHISLFLWVLIGILLWDLPSFLLSRHQRNKLKPWLYRNLKTVVGILVVVGAGWSCPRSAEVIALFLVLVVSLIDLHEVFTMQDPPKRFWGLRL